MHKGGLSMTGRLLLIFILVPLLELMLLIEVGKLIGTVYTIALIFITGVIGVFLAKTQGFLVLRNLQYALSQGEMPGAHLIDGLFILVGGLVLLTPGLITDILGFTLLFPLTRNFYRSFLINKLRHWISSGQVRVFVR